MWVKGPVCTIQQQSKGKKNKNFSDIITPKTLVKFTFWAAVDSLVTKYHHLLFCVNIYFYPVEITVINVLFFFFQCLTTVLQTCFHFLAALMDAFDDKSTKKIYISHSISTANREGEVLLIHICKASRAKLSGVAAHVWERGNISAARPHCFLCNLRQLQSNNPASTCWSRGERCFPPGRAVCLRVASLTEIMAGQFFLTPPLSSLAQPVCCEAPDP